MAELLIKAVNHTHPDATIDRQGAYKKGDIIAVEENGFDWPVTMIGQLCVLIKVPGITKTQVQEYTDPLYVRIEWELVAENEAGKRFRVWNTGSDDRTHDITRAQVETFIVNRGGVVNSIALNEVVFDMPTGTDWAALKEDILNALDRTVIRREYYFASSDVDTALAAGGIVNLTAPQLLAKVKTKAVR